MSKYTRYWKAKLVLEKAKEIGFDKLTVGETISVVDHVALGRQYNFVVTEIESGIIYLDWHATII